MKHDPNHAAGAAVAAPLAFSGEGRPLGFSMGTPVTGTPHSVACEVLEHVIEEMEGVVSLGGSPRLVAYARKWAATLSRIRDRAELAGL